MRKTAATIALIVALLATAVAGTTRFETVQAATSVTGIIFSDTTWTKAASPINMTGPTAIAKGATLTIEPGAVVHFNTYTLEVNGTLRAIGTSTEPITLNGDYRGRLPYFGSSDHNGILTFTDESDSWNAQTGTGCIIENVNVISLSIYVYDVSVNLKNNVFGGSHAYVGISVDGGDSMISGNLITDGSVVVNGGSPVFNANTLIGRAISVQGGSPTIQNSLFQTSFSGITVSDGNDVRIVNNIIFNCTGFAAVGRGSITFEHNLVLNCSSGCSLYGNDITVTVQNNTIAFNRYGIQSPPPSAKIVYNNLESNAQYSLSLGYSSNFDATYNWWGTKDASAISQTIVDYKNDYHLGNASFIPFLDAPNPQAPLISSFVGSPPSPLPEPSPSPSPEPSPSPSPSPPPDEPDDQPPPETGLGGIETAIIIALLAIVIVQAVTLGLVLRKKRHQSLQAGS